MGSPKAWLIAVAGGLTLAALVALVYALYYPPRGVEPPQMRTGGVLPERVQWRDPRPLAPATPFLDGSGATRTLADFKGEVLVVNLWATWCAPCVVELPTLDRLAAARAGSDVRVLAISIDRDAPNVVPEFLRVNGVTQLEPYSDASMAIFKDVKSRGLPVTLIVDREGREAVRVTGPFEWDGSEAAQLIDQVAGRARTAGP